MAQRRKSATTAVVINIRPIGWCRGKIFGGIVRSLNMDKTPEQMAEELWDTI
jgi:hypothetical protein